MIIKTNFVFYYIMYLKNMSRSFISRVNSKDGEPLCVFTLVMIAHEDNRWRVAVNK